MQKKELMISVAFLTLLSCFGIDAAAAKSVKKTVAVEVVKKPERKAKPININRVDLKGLEMVKGVGKRKATAILKYRKQHGKFKAIDDLLKVKCCGINQRWLDKVKQQLTL